MLKLWLGDPEGIDYIYSAGFIFEVEYEESWIEEDIVKKMILDIDKSTVISGNLIQSPVLGAIPPIMLSGGVKTLILASHDPTRIYNLTSCGDNCAKWIFELAKDKDIIMRLGHYMDFYQLDNFEFEVMQTGQIVKTYADYIDVMLQYC